VGLWGTIVKGIEKFLGDDPPPKQWGDEKKV